MSFFVAGFTGFAFTDYRQTEPVSEWKAKTLAPLNDTVSAIDAVKSGMRTFFNDIKDLYELPPEEAAIIPQAPTSLSR